MAGAEATTRHRVAFQCDDEVGAVTHEAAVDPDDAADGALDLGVGVVAAPERPERLGDERVEHVEVVADGHPDGGQGVHGDTIGDRGRPRTSPETAR